MKGPFALDDDVFLSVVMCEQLTVTLVIMQPISDDMLTTSKICVAFAKCERAQRWNFGIRTTFYTFLCKKIVSCCVVPTGIFAP